MVTLQEQDSSQYLCNFIMEWNEVVTVKKSCMATKNHDYSVMFFLCIVSRLIYTELVLHSFPDYSKSAVEAS